MNKGQRKLKLGLGQSLFYDLVVAGEVDRACEVFLKITKPEDQIRLFYASTARAMRFGTYNMFVRLNKNKEFQDRLEYLITNPKYEDVMDEAFRRPF